MIMNESILIEIHVISSHKKTVIDIDCSVGLDTTLSDILEIVFTNYHLEAEGIAAMFAFIPFDDNPLELHAQDCIKTLKELDLSNGVTFRIIYVGE